MVYDEFLIKSHIRTTPDWPAPGVQFRDISPLFHNPKVARMVTDSFVQRYIDAGLTHIAAIDARGFLLGSNLAYLLNKPLVLIRKAGKLPGAVDSETYASEYAPGTLEIQAEALMAAPTDPPPKVLLIDDLIATGGTIMAATQLLRRQGGAVAEVAAIVDLANLGGRARLCEADVPVFTLCTLAD